MKPPYREEKITVLNDEEMLKKGFEPVPLEEKIDYVESWIHKVDREILELEKKLTDAKLYGLKTPSKTLIEDVGLEQAKTVEKQMQINRIATFEIRLNRKKQEKKGYKNRLNEYRKIKRDEESNIKNRSDSNYGQHQDHKQWIIDTYQSERPNYDSENKTIQRVKALYREKFKMKIGDNTIRRYNELID